VRIRGTWSRGTGRLALTGLVWTILLACAFTVFAYRSAGESARPSRVDAGRVPSSTFEDPRPLPPTESMDTPSRVDPVYSRVATALARRATRVQCWSRADWRRRAAEWEARTPWLGELGPWRAYTLRRTIHLSPAICAELEVLVRSPRPIWRDRWPDALAWSMQALVHEAVHASGIKNEAKAECYGMQNTRTATVLLGRSAAEGRYLARLYWKHWYQWQQEPYHSPKCHKGGVLDLHRSNAWP
jgi:hypothetical protein